MFPVGKMCKVMKVSKSGYYHWLGRKPGIREGYRKNLVNHIKTIFEWSKKRYGSPRITKEMEMLGIKGSRPLVARLMRKENMRSIVKKRFKQTTDSSHSYPVVVNLLNQNFQMKEKNQAWVSDLTYINTSEGWLYLTTVIDLYDRKVIGWAMSETMKAKDTSIAALQIALIHRPLQNTQKLIFHSDRAIQYACTEFTNEVQKQKSITRSRSGKGICYDNAVAESFFKTLKTKLVYRNKYKTKHEAYLSVFEYIEGFYNTHRRHSKLRNLTIKGYQNLMCNPAKKTA